MARKLKKSWYTRKKLLYRFISLMAFFVLLGGVYEAVMLYRLYREEENIQEDIEQIDRDNRKKEKIQYDLENDPRVIEKRAREELGLIKDGDRVFQIYRPNSKNETGEDEQSDRVDTQK